MNKVLVVAPHPDDETLGCGGTLLRHRHLGDAVYWLLITGLEGAADENDAGMKLRAAEIERVKQSYGFAGVVELNIAPAGVDACSMKSLTEKIGAAIRAIEPHTVYAPFKGDVHTDHQIVFDAVLACTKVFRYPSVRRFLCYETISETDFGIDPTENRFSPNMFIDITPYMEDKIKIMELYAGEIKPHPFPRSAEAMRALAILRGAAEAVSLRKASC